LIYLLSAYGFAVLVLGGYLAWSLRRLRELEKQRLER
jgi:heme exporter protein CcmD